METNNQNKSFNGLPFYSLTFLVALLFELYWILNGPTDYFMLIGIGIIVVITGYLTIDTISKARAADLAARQAQNETMIKAQKAIYLATKKNVMETEKTREQSMKTLEVLMAGMVSSQKDLIKVITAKSDEFAAKQIAMGEPSADVGELVDKLTKSNDKLAKQVQEAVTITELVKANAELVKNVQEMFGNNLAAGAATDEPVVAPSPVVEEPVITPTPVIDEPVIAQAFNMEESPVQDNLDIPEIPETLEMPEMTFTSEALEMPEMAESAQASEPVEIPEELNSIPVDNIADMITPDPILNEAEAMDSFSNEDIEYEAPSFDELGITDELLADPIIDDSIIDTENDNVTDEMTNDINAAKMEEAQTLEDMTVAEEISPELDEEMSSNTTSSDPNAPLSEEDIAALFASL